MEAGATSRERLNKILPFAVWVTFYCNKPVWSRRAWCRHFCPISALRCWSPRYVLGLTSRHAVYCSFFQLNTHSGSCLYRLTLWIDVHFSTVLNCLSVWQAFPNSCIQVHPRCYGDLLAQQVSTAACTRKYHHCVTPSLAFFFRACSNNSFLISCFNCSASVMLCSSSCLCCVLYNSHLLTNTTVLSRSLGLTVLSCHAVMSLYENSTKLLVCIVYLLRG